MCHLTYLKHFSILKQLFLGVGIVLVCQSSWSSDQWVYTFLEIANITALYLSLRDKYLSLTGLLQIFSKMYFGSPDTSEPRHLLLTSPQIYCPGYPYHLREVFANDPAVHEFVEAVVFEYLSLRHENYHLW